MRSTTFHFAVAALLAGGACSPQLSRPGAGETSGGSRLTALGTGAVRTGHAAALLGDGRVLLAGGAVGGTPTRSAQLFDPSTGTFSPTSTGANNSLATARVNATATVLSDGRVLIVGGDDGAGHALSSAELYDPVHGTFSPAGGLTVARTHHTATRLPGGHVLVIGGADGSAVTGSVEEYTPATGGAGTWADRTALGAARTRHTATLLADGTVLVAGGEDASGTPLAAELYDPASGGSTSATTGAMTPRTRHVAVLLTNGNVLLAGGRDGSGETGASEIYAASAGTFSAGPGPVTPRIDAMAALLPDGRTVVAGGASGGVAVDDVDVYTSGAATVSSPGNLVQARAGGAATLLPSGRICLTGGGLGTAELLDRANDAWTGLTPTGYVPRHGHTATLLPAGPNAGKVLIVGGIDPYNGYLQTWQLYDPATRTLSAPQNLTNARAFHTATVLPDGSVLVTGGDHGANSFADAELFDGTGWTPVPGQMVRARSHHTATLLTNGKVLITGGSDGAESFADAELYDSQTKRFDPAGNGMAAFRVHHAATLLRDGRALVVGGDNTRSADLYDSATNTFTRIGDMNGIRARFAIAPLPDGRVLLAGGTTGSSTLADADVFDGTHDFSSTPGVLQQARRDHAAALLPSGEVLVTGGQDGSGYLASAERFEPSSGRFVASGVTPLSTERAWQTLTMLPSGQLLAWGGQTGDPLLDPALPEIYDAFAPRAAHPPDLAGSLPIGSTVPGAVLNFSTVAGSYFTGGVSGADVRSEDVNAPVFVLVRQDGEGIAYARTVSFTATSARVQVPDPLPAGWWWIRAIVGGVPGSALSVYVYDPFRLTPSEPTVPPRGSVTFSASGGAGAPYHFSLVASGSAHAEQNPVIDPTTGVYVAGATPNSVDTVQVTDRLGNAVTTDVVIGDGVTVAPPGPWAAPPLGTITFSATGGYEAGGYTFLYVTGGNRSGGSLELGGYYTAGATGGQIDDLQVFDALGNHTEVSVTVTTPLVIDPTTASVTPLGAFAFTATGGYEAGGYTWTVRSNPSGGTVDGAGNYQAGRTGSVTDVVRVSDTLGSWAEATITVGPGVTVTPAGQTVPPNGSLDFTAHDGDGTFAGGLAGWTFVTNRSGGTLTDHGDGTVTYKAGATPNVIDVVQVSDSLGNVGTVSVGVGPGVTVTPVDPGAYPGESVTLTAHGGSGTGFTFETVAIHSSGGILVDHGDGTATYTAGTARGTVDVFRVTDSLGNVAEFDAAVWPDWKPGGSGCSSGTGTGGAFALVLLALWLALGGLRRRSAVQVRVAARSRSARRAGLALVALVAVGAAGAARAQTPPVSYAFVVDRFQPLGGAYDLLGVQSAQVAGHLQKTFRLTLDYSTRPLVVRAPGMTDVALLKSQLQANLSFSLGFRDWAEISADLPYMLSQTREQDRFLPPDLRASVAKSGLGDARITPKVRLLEYRKFRLGVSMPVGLPLGNQDAFLGAGGVTFAPTALFELDALGPARLLVNGGAVIRPERRLVDLTVGNAFTYGAALEWPFSSGAQRFAALGTFQGESAMKSSPAGRPMELLAGLRWYLPSNLHLTLGGGPGLGKGYGTPQYRAFLELGYTTAGADRLAEKEPPPKPEPEPQPEPATPPKEEPKPEPKEEPKAEPPPQVVDEPKAPEPPEPKPGQPVPLPEPEVQPDGSLRIDARVYFDFNKKEIKPEYRKVLRHVAQRILEEPRMRVIRIEGHADDLGPPDYNLWLSEERARAVKDFLEKCGVPSGRFAVIGFGKTKPTAPGRTSADRAKNRRVEFSVQEY